MENERYQSPSHCKVWLGRSKKTRKKRELEMNELATEAEREPLPANCEIASSSLNRSTPQPPGSTKEVKSLWILIKKMPWRKRLCILTATLVNVSSMACFAIMAPFMPLEAESKGIDTVTVGMIMSCFEIVMLVATLFFGRYMAVIGVRFMYISGIFISATSIISFGVLEWCPPGATFAAMAFICRIVEAIGCAMCQTAAMSLICCEFPDHVATMMGILESSIGFGLMAGPPLGGALYQVGGFFLPFVSMGGCLFLTGAIAAFTLPKSVDTPKKDRSKLFRSFIKLPVVLYCALCVATSSALGTFIDPVLSLQLTKIDVSLASSQALLGLIFFICPFIYAICSPLIGVLSDKISSPIILTIVGNVGLIFSFILMGPSPVLSIVGNPFWLILFSLALLGLFMSFGMVPTFAAMDKTCTDAGLPNDIDLYGLIAGLFGSAFNLGAFTGPMLGGLLVQEFGFEWATSTFALVPLLDLLALLVLLIIYLKNRHNRT